MTDFDDFKKSLYELATEAKRDMAWIAAIHVVLKSGQQNIIPLARELLINPESNLGFQNLPPAEAKKERDKAVGSFHKFCDCATRDPSDDPGHYLNKSAILYADSILQAFLNRTYEIIASFKSLPKKQLTQASVRGKLNEINSIVPESSLSTARHAKFITELRHIISHNNGLVDEKFLEHCHIDLTNMQVASGKNPLWDIQIWPDAQSFLKNYKPPKNGSQFQADLAIEKVIIPYLKHSIDFIEEFLKESLKNCKPNSCGK